MTETKKIPLTNGGFALCDADDYERLMQYKWFKSGKGYALCSRKQDSSGISMHRMLLNPPKGMCADHINGDRLDNRRCNLRIANKLQNAQNRANNRNSFSKYKGVAWKIQNCKWQARIRVNKQQYHIGLFDTEEEAALAYNEAAKRHHGEYARLNVLPLTAIGEIRVNAGDAASRGGISGSSPPALPGADGRTRTEGSQSLSPAPDIRTLFDPNRHCDAQRVIDWIDDPQRELAVLAFTEGLERQIAYRFETAAASSEVRCVQGQAPAGDGSHDAGQPCPQSPDTATLSPVQSDSASSRLGSGAVQSAAERHRVGASASAGLDPAQEGDALIPESAPATQQPEDKAWQLFKEADAARRAAIASGQPDDLSRRWKELNCTLTRFGGYPPDEAKGHAAYCSMSKDNKRWAAERLFQETLILAEAAMDRLATRERETTRPWADRPDQWQAAIDAAHPSKTGKHKTYAKAMEMVGNRHSKGALVELVNWLLAYRRPTEAGDIERESGWRPIETAPKDGTEIIGFDASEVQVVAFTDGGNSEYIAEWWGIHSDQAASPTHWMPLPKAPVNRRKS